MKTKKQTLSKKKPFIVTIDNDDLDKINEVKSKIEYNLKRNKNIYIPQGIKIQFPIELEDLKKAVQELKERLFRCDAVNDEEPIFIIIDEIFVEMGK